MGRLAILALRAVIALMFASLLVVQGMVVPAIGRDLEEAGPDVAHLQWPMMIIVFLGVLAVQVALVCIWQLLTMVRRDTVFSAAAFRYVDIIIGAAVGATLLAIVLSFLLAPGEDVAPGIVLLIVIGGMAPPVSPCSCSCCASSWPRRWRSTPPRPPCAPSSTR